MRKIPTINKLSIIILIFSFLSGIGVLHAASGDPVSMLQNVANNMIAGLKANKANLRNKPQIVYRLAHQYVVPHADLPLMAKQVLPPQVWNNATPAQRAEFQKLFTTTLIRTYASALSSYEDQSIHFYPLRDGSGSTVEVSSEIEGSGNQPIHVTYRVVRTSGGWKLIDLSVEGVSMLESFRDQFADILSQGNMAELLQRMSRHNNR